MRGVTHVIDNVGHLDSGLVQPPNGNEVVYILLRILWHQLWGGERHDVWVCVCVREREREREKEIEMKVCSVIVCVQEREREKGGEIGREGERP